MDEAPPPPPKTGDPAASAPLAPRPRPMWFLRIEHLQVTRTSRELGIRFDVTVSSARQT